MSHLKNTGKDLARKVMLTQNEDMYIPVEVFDELTPLLGGEAVTTYILYCRLNIATRGEPFQLNLDNIAQMLRLSPARLKEINAALEHHGLITVDKPEDQSRLTRITVLDTKYVALNSPDAKRS